MHASKVTRPSRPGSAPGPLALWLTCIALLLWPSAARAQEAGSAHVLVVVAGDAVRSSALMEALRDPARRLGVNLDVVQVRAVVPQRIADGLETPDAFAARVWFDLTAPERASLYLTDRSWKRVCERHLVLDAGFDEVAIEQIVYIVRTSLDSFLSGQAICMRREEFARTLPPPASPTVDRPARAVVGGSSQPSRLRPSVSSAYELQSLGVDRAVAHGSELGVGLAAENFLAKLGLQWRVPVRIERDAVGVELQSFALRVLGGYETHLDSGWVLRAALGGGAEWTRAKAYPLEPDLSLDPPHWGLDPVARASVAVGHSFGIWSLMLPLGVDLDLARARYVLMGSSGTQVLFSRARWRPFVALELVIEP